MKRSTAFFINGGAGRVVTSIPAFELYEKENPDDDFIIVCEGGMDFYKGHPTLHKRAYDTWHKGLFEQFIKDRDCVSPEPYRIWEYYNQQCSIAQAFDIEINKKGIRDLPAPTIDLNKSELIQGKGVVDEVRAVTGFDKILVIQPFGRGVEESLIDSTSRSFRVEDMLGMANQLKQEYGIIIMSEHQLNLYEENENEVPLAQPQIPDLRIWSAVIKEADHFLGCDSVGQHVAKALGTPATVVTGSTFPINTSYLNDKDVTIFDIGEGRRVYSPIRASMEEEPDRVNDKAMNMSNTHVNDIVKSIKGKMGKSKKSAPRQPSEQMQQPQGEVCPTHGVVHRPGDGFHHGGNR
jgi:ADP-heptose:LPS heptosyltransferase